MNKDSISAVSFIIELVNPPMRHEVQKTNKIFTELGNVYTNCTRTSDNSTQLSSIDQNTRELKTCTIKGDRVIIENTFTSSTLDSFWRTSKYVIGEIIKSLQIPLFIFRQHTVRLTAALMNSQDSRLFLGKNVCRLENSKLTVLKRRLHGFGIRFVFPPQANQQSEYTVRVESLLQDISRVFLENQARFFRPIQIRPNIDYMSQIQDELTKTYSFLTDNISDFLVQYNQ